MVEYYAYSIYHGQTAALGGRDRTHGLAVGAFKQSCTNASCNEPAGPEGRRPGLDASTSRLDAGKTTDAGLDASMPKLDASMLFEVEATICRVKDEASTRLDAPRRITSMCPAT